MKATILLSLLLLLVTQATFAQKLKDKINQLTTGGPEVHSTKLGSENQYEMIEPFITAPKVWEATIKNNVVTEIYQTDMVNRLKSFDKNANGQVSRVTTSNYLTPDHNEFPRSFTDGKYEQLIIVKNYAFVINIDNGTNSIKTIKSAADVDQIIFGEQSFNLILALNKSDLTGITIEKIKEIIKTYFNESAKGMDVIKAKEAALEEEKNKLYSIKDKKVKSIKIVTDAEFIRYKENVPFSIVATLEDGKTMTTSSDSKYMADYNIEISGMENNPNPSSLINMFYYTPTDKITLKVTSKYNTAINATKVFKMKYEIAANYTGEPGKFSFSSQAGQSPYHGLSTRVEIKQVKDANTGATLIAVKIFDLTATKPHFAFKCAPSELIDLNIGGKRNMSAESSGIGKPGYNGGDLKIIIDPNVTEAYNLTYSTKGGAGSEGKAGDGAPGKDGKVETVKQKVTW
jgi:hypothetical protein